VGVPVAGGTGCFEIKVTPDGGTESTVWSKLGGDKKVDSTCVAAAVDKIKTAANK